MVQSIWQFLLIVLLGILVYIGLLLIKMLRKMLKKK